jgi:hypothetical protein
MQRLATVASVIALASMTALPSMAQTTVIDPQIYIQQTDTVTPSNNNSPAGGDPNLITNPNSITVGVAGNHTLDSPLLIGVAVYNGQDVPTISFSGCSSPSACPTALGSTLYGETATAPVTLTSTTGTGASQGKALDALGLTGDGSESFTNFSAADVSKLGLPPATDYVLYLFEVPAVLSQNNPITIDTTAMLGDFLFSYDCEGAVATGSACASNGDIGQTPFTNAGLIDAPPTPTPEPSTIFMFGTGLLGLAGMVRAAKSKGGMRLYRDA